MASEQASRSRRGKGEHKSMRHKIKGFFKGFFWHKKNATIPQAGSQVAQPKEDSKTTNDSELLQPSKHEMSLENSLKRQKSPLATGQEPHPPLTQHGHGKDLVAIEDARNSKDSAIGDAKNPEDSADGDAKNSKDSAIGDAKNPEDSAIGDAKNSKDSAIGDAKNPEDSADGDAKNPEDSADGDAKNSKDSAIGDVKNPEDSADGDAKNSKDLWLQAYEALKRRDKVLVAAYEHQLADLASTITNSADPSLSPELMETIINSELQHREADQWVVKVGQKPVKVREQGEKVIKFILWSNDIVSQALSAQPYAALAWSGVSILLPLLLNSSKQSDAMIEGLNSISDLLRLYRVIEKQYLRDANKPDLVQAVVELYCNIFEYQTRLICHLSQSSFKRAVRGTLELDNWGDMLKKVQTSNDSCMQYCTLSDRDRENAFYNNAQTHMVQSLDIQKRILDMFEASQASGQQDRREDKEDKLLESLASDYKSDKDSVSVRVPGTCEWFFEDKRFLEWRDNEHSRLLWVSAGPGCGKSVLSRSLIDDRRVCTSAMTSTVCYFFFKDGQEQRMRGANALSAMLHQLFENTALISHALPKARTYGTKLRDTFGELWEILIKCAQDSEAGEIICIIDALDECEKNSRCQLQDELVRFSSQVDKSSSHKLKFLVTSRPYDDLEDGFRPLSDVSTYLHFDEDDKSQRIGQDIDLVIDHEMPRIAKGFSAEHCNSITKRLKKMNNRTYLWLFLTIDIITRSPSAYGKESDIGSLLSDLPSEVSSAYEKILSRSSDPERARILLQLIMAATRPLSLQEVNIALTLATQKENCTSYKQLDLWPPENFKSTIQNICGLFVSVHDGKVSLIHQTAREFLLIRNTELPSNKWQGYLDMTTAHCTMFQICLDYLNLHEFAIPVDQLDPDNPLQQRDELFKYAALNWAIHYVSQDSERVKDSCGAAKLCDISLPQRSDWFDTYCDEAYLYPADWNSLGIASLLGLKDVAETFLNKGADIGAQGEGFANALCAASEGGHEKVVQMLLDKGADININTQGRLYDNALCAALQEGYEKIVQMLLDKEADFDAQNGYYGNALCVASRGGYEKVVQILLKKEVDINIQGEYYGDALYAASQEGHEKVVEMLLDKEADGFGKALCAASGGGYEKVVQMFLNKEADVSAQGESFGNALYAASEGGHKKVVQMLLDKGVDVKAQGEEYSSALQAALFGGYDQIVQLLLGKGADINAQGGDYGTALQAASLGGYDQMVQMLLDKGADVKAQGGKYGTALQAASSGGYDKVVQMLLDRGVDVNAQGGYYGNALQAASSGGYDKVVLMLLDRGVDVKAQGEEALQAASSGGYDKVVLMLLDRGVDVNAQGGYYGNALQVASSGGYDKVVLMLLDRGVDVNAQGGYYGNALQAALAGGYDELVQILLDKGADVKAPGGKYGIIRW